MPEAILAAAVSAGIPAAVKLYQLIRDKRKDTELEAVASQLLAEILQWQGTVGDLQAKLIDLQQVNAGLNKEIVELRRRAARGQEFICLGGVCFRKTAAGRGLDQTPYCQPCLENDDRVFRMVTYGDIYACPECVRLERHAHYPARDIVPAWHQATASLSQTS